MIGQPSLSQVIFSKNFKSLMIRRDLSQQKIQDLCRVSRSHLSSVLNGQVGLTFYVMDRLCSAVKVSPREMLEERS